MHRFKYFTICDQAKTDAFKEHNHLIEKRRPTNTKHTHFALIIIEYSHLRFFSPHLTIHYLKINYYIIASKRVEDTETISH